MQIGDLTSGVNMLPDNSLNKGIQDYFKQETSIVAQKGQLAQNKINEVNNLLNVNLKGLQSRDMNEAVAAKEKLLQSATEAARSSSPYTGEIAWPKMRGLIAQKDALEQMAQQSQDTQQLYKTRFQQINNLKDVQQKQQAFKNLNIAYNLPTISARAAALNSAAIIPDMKYTVSEAAKDEYTSTSKDPTPQNKNGLIQQAEINVKDEAPKTMFFYDKWKVDHPDGTVKDFAKKFGSQIAFHKLNGSTLLSKFTQRQAAINAAKKAVKRTVIHSDIPGGDVYSFNGVNINGKKNGIVPLGNVPIPNEVNKDYPNATLVRIQTNQKTGVREAVISYTTDVAVSSSDPLQQRLHEALAKNNVTLNLGGTTKKGSATAVIPLSVLTNTFRTNNIHFDNKQLEQLVYGGADPKKIF